MLLIPTGTDAPIYHWPRATVAVMVLNVAAFVAVSTAGDAASDFDRYALALGDGLHPVQWVTHNFLHYDIGHLIGNLVFLWAFGLVVEGKLGTVKFLAAYLAIGTLHGALVQTLMLRSGLHGSAAGASAVVFGLPGDVHGPGPPRNEPELHGDPRVGVPRLRSITGNFYYTTVALFYLGEQLVGLAFGGLTGGVVVSELGHLSGAFWGTVLAVGLLKAGWVDCEGWDIFSVLTKRRALARQWKERGESLARNERSLKAGVKAATAASRFPVRSEARPEERAAAAVRRVQNLIEMGDMSGAVSAYDKSARTLVAWPAQADLLAMIKAMHSQKAEADSIRLMRDHCRYYPAESVKLRLKLAHVLIHARQRPTAALRVLSEIPPSSLPPDLETARKKLARQAARMQEEGVLVLEGDD